MFLKTALFNSKFIYKNKYKVYKDLWPQQNTLTWNIAPI